MSAIDLKRTSLDRKAVGAVILGNALEFCDFTTYSFLANQDGPGDAYWQAPPAARSPVDRNFAIHLLFGRRCQ